MTEHDFVNSESHRLLKEINDSMWRLKEHFKETVGVDSFLIDNARTAMSQVENQIRYLYKENRFRRLEE